MFPSNSDRDEPAEAVAAAQPTLPEGGWRNDELSALESALSVLADADPGAMADMSAMARLQRASNRLEAIFTRAAGSFDREGDWATTGALSAAAWLAGATRIRPAEARTRVSVGRGLSHLPHTTEAFLAGDISPTHARRMTQAWSEARAEAMDRDEEVLVGLGKEAGFDQFSSALAYWKGLTDPDADEEESAAKRDKRDVWLTRSFDDMYLGGITLDPLSGLTVASELERLEREMYETDWAEAKARLGRRPLKGELARSPAQRRADALVEMATRSRTAPADGIRPAPLFTVLVDYRTFMGRICELADGSVLSPGSLLPWLTPAYIERAVFDLRGRAEVSERARLFRGATLRAIQIRDRAGCTHPYCSAPAWRCQADHIQPYSEGGLTTQDNGRLACVSHNRARVHTPDTPEWPTRYGFLSDDDDDRHDRLPEDEDPGEAEPPGPAGAAGGRSGPDQDNRPPSGSGPGGPAWGRPPPAAA